MTDLTLLFFGRTIEVFGLRPGRATGFSDLSELFCRNMQETAQRKADGRAWLEKFQREAGDP